ncbi:MAG: hypothetical protein KJO98_04895 [Rhodothermia bacterium]|nr:hypothetical protein [Rhodothermia bacterium]
MQLLASLLFLLPAAGAAGRDRPTTTPDTVKVLIVFVKFLDDTTPGSAQVNYRDWPLYRDPTQLPASAPYLISNSAHPPHVDSTLTAYFYQQSNGKLVVFGDVYDRAIVSSKPESSYHRPGGGYADLTYDVVRQLDAAGVDFSDYDFNRDGVLDQLFMIIRRDSEKDAGRVPWTGASCLDARCGNGAPAGKRLPPLTVDGTLIDWNLSGSVIFNRTPGNVAPHYWLVRMMAHEYGHDLWRQHFVHIPAITNNDVPEQSSFRRATNTLGYVLMAGAGGGYDARGDETISAFERDLLGWIECRQLSTSQTNVIVRDLYTSGDCVRLETARRTRPSLLYVTNRQRIGPFDRYRQSGAQEQFEIGLLRTTGLLVGLAFRNRYEVLPADNNLVLSTRNEDYEGDLFQPGSQLTPWTRPSINGFTRYPADSEPFWHAIDNIRRHPTDRRVIVFDYVDDFRESIVVRQNSWMGRESSGTELSGRGRIVGGRLIVDSDIHVTGRLTIEEGATLEIGRAGRVQIHRSGSVLVRGGGRLRVDGALHVEGVMLPLAESQIEIGRTAQLTAGTVR